MSSRRTEGSPLGHYAYYFGIFSGTLYFTISSTFLIFIHNSRHILRITKSIMQEVVWEILRYALDDNSHHDDELLNARGSIGDCSLLHFITLSANAITLRSE